METIVYIHGFAAHWTVFLPCSAYLRCCGFRSKFWGYPTLREPFDNSAKRFASSLAKIDEHGRKFHIVAHSMGSIVTLLALQYAQLNNLGRIVFLAPPMQGVPIAGSTPKFLNTWITNLESMSDGPNGLHRSVRFNDSVPTMVIAARYDALVPLRNTHLPGRHERLELIATHNSLLIDPRVFMRIGRFLRGKTE